MDQHTQNIITSISKNQEKLYCLQCHYYHDIYREHNMRCDHSYCRKLPYSDSRHFGSYENFPKFMENELLNDALFRSLAGYPADVCSFIVLMMSQKYVYWFRQQKWFKNEGGKWKSADTPYEYIKTNIVPIYRHLTDYYRDNYWYTSNHSICFYSEQDDYFLKLKDQTLQFLQWLAAQLADSNSCNVYIDDICEVFVGLYNDDHTLFDKVARQIQIGNGNQSSYKQDLKAAYKPCNDRLTPLKMSKTIFDVYWFYIRGYNELVAKVSRSQSHSKIIFDSNIIKIGIAASLSQRAQTYGNDNGWFYYAIPLESEKDALHVEGIFRKMFQPYAIQGSKEYFDAEKVATYLNISDEPRRYDLTLKSLHELALTFSHVARLGIYGYKYIPSISNDHKLEVTRKCLISDDVSMEAYSSIRKPEIKSEQTQLLEIERERSKQLKLKNDNLVLEKEILHLKMAQHDAKAAYQPH